MKEIKVEKDVVLSDSKYYLKMMWNEIKVMLEDLDVSSERKFFDRVHELFDGYYLLSVCTHQLEIDIIDFKNGKNIDIDSNINDYNDACNTVIRNLINKERV